MASVDWRVIRQFEHSETIDDGRFGSQPARLGDVDIERSRESTIGPTRPASDCRRQHSNV